jgi:hypothetical protein
MAREHPARFVTRCFPRAALEQAAQRMAAGENARHRVPWDDLVERASDEVAGPRFDLRASMERCLRRKSAWRASLEACAAFRRTHRGSMSAMDASRWEGGDERYRDEMDREEARFASLMLAEVYAPQERAVVYVLSFDEYLDDLVYDLHCHAQDSYDELDIDAVCAYPNRAISPRDSTRDRGGQRSRPR